MFFPSDQNFLVSKRSSVKKKDDGIQRWSGCSVEASWRKREREKRRRRRRRRKEKKEGERKGGRKEGKIKDGGGGRKEDGAR